MRKEYLWALLTLVIAIILALILMLIVHDDPRSQSSKHHGPSFEMEPPPSQYDEHLLELDKQALERSYQAQLQLLFATWLRDDISTTYRVENGLRIARRAYIYAADQLEKRSDALESRRKGAR